MKNTEHYLIGLLFLMVAGLTIIVFLPRIDSARDQSVTTVPLEEVESLSVKESIVHGVTKGQIEYVEGTVEKRKGLADGWRAVTDGEVINDGESLRTLTSSRAVMTLEDGSVVRLNENTSIILNSSDNMIMLLLEDGEIFNKVAKSDVHAYSVSIDGTKVKALGTAFDVEKTNENISAVSVLESEVEVMNNRGEIVGTVSQGEKSEISEGKIKKEDLNDDDLADEFIAWNIKEEKMDKDAVKKDTKEKKEESKKEEDNKGDARGIVLSGKQTDSGVKLYWETNTSVPHGFKIVRSLSTNPVYPGDKYIYISDKKTDSYHWETTGGKVYHFRVCAYNGDGGCIFYSNDIAVETPAGKSNKYDDKEGDGDYASSISLSGKAKSDGRVKLEWSIAGGGAPKGFKVVTSREKNPVYPGDTYKYISDGDARSYVWEKNLKEGKTYYFRVCIYKGGKCGAYSNNISVKIED